MMKIVECPICGKQDPIGLAKSRLIRLFDTRLLNRNYKKALKGNYHTWTCSVCENKFIISNVLCVCSDGKGIVIKSEKPRQKFLCSGCESSVCISKRVSS